MFGPKRIRQHSVGAESSQLDQQSLHLSTGSAQPLWFRALFIALLFGLFSVEVSCEYNLLMYLAPYLSRGRANISRQSAANLSATFGLAYVTGRGTSMLLALSRRVPVSSVFYTQMMTALIAGVLFAVRSLSDHAWAIWAAVILIGLGFSSAFPNMMVFIEQRVNITDRLNCAMLALSTLLFSACSPLLGHVLDARPQTFERIMIGAIVALLSLFAALHFTDRIRNRLNKQFQMRSAANSRF